ncbi:hypothetical protein A33M_2513 [Rhodovulum sp. PH10]|nr:hypothetical protein A33M_2513 [Rhodovulum sp. PH10]
MQRHRGPRSNLDSRGASGADFYAHGASGADRDAESRRRRARARTQRHTNPLPLRRTRLQ